MMSTVSKACEVSDAAGADLSAADPFDTSLHFDRWLQELPGGQKPPATHELEAFEEENSEFYIGSFPGSNCDLAFEGVLHFDGYSIGNITSPDGTLVLTQRGRIEADINVGIAVINGWVTGNITASERVVLESESRVTGQIRTPALSVRLGAVFDGECVLTANAGHLGNQNPSGHELSEELEQMAMGAGV